MLSLFLMLFGLHGGTQPRAELMAATRSGPWVVELEARRLGRVDGVNLPELPGDEPSRAPEWIGAGRRAMPVFRADVWLAPRGAASERTGVARAARWLAALPVQVDVHDSGVYVALRLPAP